MFAAIKDQVSIVAVAEVHMMLKRYGSRYKGLCPYHAEKSPSFVIYTDTNRFHCFSCKVSGDNIDLYSHLNGMDTKGAMKSLAEAYGVDSTIPCSPSAYEVERILRNKKTALRLQIGTHLFDLEELYFRIDSPELDSAFYQEFQKMEYWLANVDGVNEYTVDKLIEVMPQYFAGLHDKFWGGEGRAG